MLTEYLELLQRRGQEAVWVDDSAKKLLRKFYLEAHQKEAVSPHAKSSNRATETPRQGQVASAAPPSVAAEVPVSPAMDISAAGSLEQLFTQMQNDTELSNVGALKTKFVAANGSARSGIMLVSESPSYHDEQAGLPFSGPAGKKMAAILKAMGLQLDDVHSTYLVKYRPNAVGQTINTRKPSREEVDAFLPYLKREIELVQPKVIIALGSSVAKALVGHEVSAKQLLGRFNDAFEVPVRSTYHPSYLLQEGITPEKKWVWKDMLAIMELLEMPISEKQRSYFS